MRDRVLCAFVPLVVLVLGETRCSHSAKKIENLFAKLLLQTLSFRGSGEKPHELANFRDVPDVEGESIPHAALDSQPKPGERKSKTPNAV